MGLGLLTDAAKAEEEPAAALAMTTRAARKVRGHARVRAIMTVRCAQAAKWIGAAASCSVMGHDWCLEVGTCGGAVAKLPGMFWLLEVRC